MPGKRLFAKPSVNYLLNQTPIGGCLIVFNAAHHDWRSKASDIGVFHVNQFECSRYGEGKSPPVCDIYVTFKEGWNE